ncbi:hypothetical protein V5279_28995 [Bradyrhizobium sp. 26S5]|uniref:hypothetical protein n=1 Tax=Bradyrhizobium sp. 26S5 TaxID=3139729 RepID=UPI0030D3AB7F
MIELLSVMAWPSDEVARNQFTASVMSENLARLQSLEEPLPDAATNWIETIEFVEDHEECFSTSGFVENWFLEVGGFRSVARAGGLENLEAIIAGCEKGWLSTGLILALVRRMDEHHPDLVGGASVSKALHIVETVEVPLTIRNKRDLQKAWKAYKPVAHFCAALFDRVIRSAADPGADAPDDDPLNDMMSFLGEADAYLNFGTSFIPARTESTLLDPGEVWDIPHDAIIIPTALVPAPLSGELLAAAQSYKAPVPSN